MVLGCYEQWSQIHADNCTEDLGRICQSEGTEREREREREREGTKAVHFANRLQRLQTRR